MSNLQGLAVEVVRAGIATPDRLRHRRGERAERVTFSHPRPSVSAEQLDRLAKSCGCVFVGFSDGVITLRRKEGAK